MLDKKKQLHLFERSQVVPIFHRADCRWNSVSTEAILCPTDFPTTCRFFLRGDNYSPKVGGDGSQLYAAIQESTPTVWCTAR